MAINIYVPPQQVVPAGAVVTIMFSSYASTGASATISGLTVAKIEIYKNGGTTQRASDAGYVLLDTDGIDFDGITGVHGFSVNTGDGTTSGFWEIGSTYHVVVSSITVDSQTVNFIAKEFRLGPPETVLGVPVVETAYWAGDKLKPSTVPGVPEVDTTHWNHQEPQIPRVPGVPTADNAYVLGFLLEEDSSRATKWGAK